MEEVRNLSSGVCFKIIGGLTDMLIDSIEVNWFTGVLLLHGVLKTW